MNAKIEKTLDYRCFLLGIIIYWMFDSIWTSFTTFLFSLETVLHPIAMVVGKSLLFLIIFYLLFRKPRIFNVKWKHIAIFVGIVVFMILLSTFISDRLIDLNSYRDNQLKWNISNFTMQNVRNWANIATSLLTVGFLWWRYDSKATVEGMEISPLESKNYYGGMLFSITLGYILSLIKMLGNEYWTFAHHPILVEVITCVLIILVTIGAICMLVRRQTVVLSITAILIIIAIHFFSSHYLLNILSKHFSKNHELFQLVNFFVPVPVACSIAFKLAAFILYRKEFKRQNV